MEKNRQDKNRDKNAIPADDKKNELNTAVTGKEAQKEKEPGRLPNDEFGVDHNSDNVLSKNE